MATTETTPGLTESKLEVVLSVEIAKVPIKVCGSVQGGVLEELSGVVAIDKSLNQFLADLGPDFRSASDLLTQLTGGPDIKLDSLAFAYHTKAPKFVQVIVTLTAGKSRCRFVCLKSVGTAGPKDKSSFIVGVELRLDQDLFKNSFLSGLIGDISLGDMGIYYASNEFLNVAYDPDQDVQSADALTLSTLPTPPRDFTQGMNWTAQISIGAMNLIDWPPKKDTSKPASASPAPPQRDNTAATPKLADSTTWIDLNKSLGPLSVQRIGLGYEAPRVAIKFDATLGLSVLTLSLQGLGLSYPLDKIMILKDDPWKFFTYVDFQLDGAAVTMQQGPLAIAGALMVVSRDPLQLDGALIIRTSVFSITALGSYAQIAGQTSLFVFAVLHVDLGGPTFFHVTGLAVGFGYNRKLKLPPIEEVENFPLVRAALDETYLLASGATNPIMTAMTRLRPYITPSVGDYWFAVGVRFTSFEMIVSFALLSVSFGNEVEIGLLGLSTLAIPRGTKPGQALVYAELALRVVISPSQGLMAVEARLTKESYVFTRDCHLTGGFALYIWFAGPHAGDFVLTLGGYHPKFKRPDHYPTVPRLGVNWQVTSELTIVAQFYCALTASCFMAGGKLSAVYLSGCIKAWFIAYADFLLNWAPFYFLVDMGISLGVEVNLRIPLGICTIAISFSIHLGVGLHLWGPEFAGVIDVDLTVISFSITFGPGKAPPPPLTEKEFAGSFLPPKTEVLGTQISSGLIAEQKTGKNAAIRVVNAHALALTTQSVVPVSNFTGLSPRASVAADQPDSIGIRSMGKTSLESKYGVTIKRGAGTVDRADNIRVSLVKANVPDALWGPSDHDKEVKLATEPAAKMLVAWAGLRISFDPKYPQGELPAMGIGKFAYEDLLKPIPWNDGLKCPGRLSGDEEKGKGILTIMDDYARERRNDVLSVLGKQVEFADPSLTASVPALNDVDLTGLVKAGDSYFQDTPKIRRLGEALV